MIFQIDSNPKIGNCEQCGSSGEIFNVTISNDERTVSKYLCRTCAFKAKQYVDRKNQIAQNTAVSTVNDGTSDSFYSAPQKRLGKKSINKKIIAVILASIILLSSVATGFVCWKLNKKNEIDYENVGEIYYKETPAEHIAETNFGIMYADNELLVVAKDGVKKSKIEKLAKKYDASVVGFIEATGDYQWELNKTYTKEELESLITRISEETKIESTSLNYLFEVNKTSFFDADNNGSLSEIVYGNKWEGDLKKSADNKGKSWGVEAIKAPEAWEILDENKDKINPVRVGIIDNGFDETHEDLPFKQVFYNDGFQNDYIKGSKQEQFEMSHGTHVSGTFAANGLNSIGICGVYPYANEGGLYGAVFTNFNNYKENNGSLINEKVCFAELLLRNVKVINCSYGYGDYYGALMNYYSSIDDSIHAEGLLLDFNNLSDLMGDFLDKFIRKGYDFVIVKSAGNSSNKEVELPVDESKIIHRTSDVNARFNGFLEGIRETRNPNAYNRIIVVGAINSDFSPYKHSNNGERVDIWAPGTDIYSTVPLNKYDNGDEWSGTSMAAPHVAGVAASVWSLANNLTGPQIKSIIKSAINVEYSELPIINMKLAVNMALNNKEEGSLKESANGLIMGFVVDNTELLQMKKNNNEKFASVSDWYKIWSDDFDINKISVKNAEICIINEKTNKTLIEKTDTSGHFECVLSPGDYKLTVTADGYETYEWPETIKVESGQVHYLEDWIKLHKPFSDNQKESAKLLVNYLFEWGTNRNTVVYEFLNNGSVKVYSCDCSPSKIKSRDDLKLNETLKYIVDSDRLVIKSNPYDYNLVLDLKTNYNIFNDNPKYVEDIDMISDVEYAFYDKDWIPDSDDKESCLVLIPIIKKSDLLDSGMNAQDSSSITVTGIVKNKSTQSPIKNINVKVYSTTRIKGYGSDGEVWETPKDKVVKTLKTDSSGKYSLSLPEGIYIFEYSANGYELKESEPISINTDTLTLPTVYLTPVNQNEQIIEAYKKQLSLWAWPGQSGFYPTYTIYDIDKDGTPELIIRLGDNEAEYRWKFYTFENGDIIELGEYTASHSALYGISNENGVYAHEAIQGYERLVKLEKENGKIVPEVVIAEHEVEHFSNGDDYTQLPNYLEEIPVTDYSLVYNIQNKME